MSALAIRLRAFDTAYPGSMVERDDGGYVRRDDNQALIAALAANIAADKAAIQDLQDAANDHLTNAAPDMLQALRAVASAWGNIPGMRAPMGLKSIIDAAIARATGGAP
jgi:hypothetical protein